MGHDAEGGSRFSARYTSRIGNTAAGLPRSFRATFDIVVETIGGSGLGYHYDKTQNYIVRHFGRHYIA